MKRAYHQFILLGLVCQGFSWDGYLLALFNALLWALALSLPRKPLHVPPVVECLGILLGGLGGYMASRAFGQSVHFSFGHAITMMQVMRLLRPLTRREQFLSLIAACMQIGVACTIVLDYRFIVIFLGIAILLPRAFMELELSEFDSTATAGQPRRFKLGWMPGLIIVSVALVFFISFPRGFLGMPMQFRRGPSNQPTLADSVLDPANSGLAQSRQVLLQINGLNIGYLRCFALSKIDGSRWAPEQRYAQRYIDFVKAEDLARYPKREVRVKQAAVLGRIVPTDGRVVFLRGNFFQFPFVNNHGSIEGDSMWNRPKNGYEYWIDSNPEPVALNRREIERFTQYPEASPRLKSWLAERIGGINEPMVQARVLESYFRQTFTYELGAPELNRLNPTEDFIFNERRGHCERFAATLALLLRMQGIPSRVVVGYVPNSKDWFSGWWNVRFADAHAWTEGWFPGRGWVQFDATPRGTMPPEGFSARQLLEDLDFAWYAHVVNFDAPSQNELFTNIGRGLTSASLWLREHVWVLVIPIGAFGGYLVWKRKLWQRWPGFGRKASSPMLFAQHQYGEMLRLLHRHGLNKAPDQTPIEFLQILAGRPPPFFADVELITRVFCETRYGMKPMPATRAEAIESALGRIRQSDGCSTPQLPYNGQASS